MKKKRIILPVVIFVLFCAIIAAIVLILRNEPEAEMNEMVTVYCISEIRYAGDGKEPQTTYKMEYDENGNLISCTKYSAMNNKTKTSSFEYDERGNCTLAVVENNMKKVYVFDTEDRILREEEYWDGKIKTEYTYSYDEEGRVLIYTAWMYGNEIETVYTYDKKGNLIKQETMSDGRCTECTTYTYDNRSRVLSAVTTGSYGEDSCVYYQYDLMGNEISYKRYQGDELRINTTRTYDIFGRLKTEETKDGDELTYSATYTYDIKGNVKRIDSLQGAEIYIDSPGELRPVVITYKYDRYGNVVERIKNYDDQHTDVFSWVYDKNGNMLVEEYWGSRYERTYDQWGNILTKRQYTSSGSVRETFYTYVSFSVPRWLAEKIMAQQEQFIDANGLVLIG